MQSVEKIKYWFFTVSRGYSLPMSFLNWLIVFTLSVKMHGNIFYGILALIAIILAHMGTNLFDDCVDFWLKQPKQKCKTQYLENGFTNIRTVFMIAMIYFIITCAIGFFFLLKCGIEVLYIALAAGIIIFFYPRLNNFALGEAAVGLTFGILMFAGVSFVMTGEIPVNTLLISLPVSLLTVAVVYVHALMDYDFDVKSGKKTLCILLGSKQKGLIGLQTLYLLTFILHGFLVFRYILPVTSIFVLIAVPFIFKLIKYLKKYIIEAVHEKDSFMKNFKAAVNISVIYNIILILSILRG